VYSVAPAGISRCLAGMFNILRGIGERLLSQGAAAAVARSIL
jgi:hypothetical protein